MIDEDHRTSFITLSTNTHSPVCLITPSALRNHKEAEKERYVLQEYSWKQHNGALLLQTGKPVQRHGMCAKSILLQIIVHKTTNTTNVALPTVVTISLSNHTHSSSGEADVECVETNVSITWPLKLVSICEKYNVPLIRRGWGRGRTWPRLVFLLANKLFPDTTLKI